MHFSVWRKMACSGSSPAEDAMHFICQQDELLHAKRIVKTVNNRDILVLYNDGVFYAMDVRCYHSSGPLQLGDIEEFGGRLCIVCPWHKYKITLTEGEGLYQSVDPMVRPPRPGPWRSKGVKQRVHQVTELDGSIYVILNSSPEPVESDCYQTAKFRATLAQTQNQRK